MRRLILLALAAAAAGQGRSVDEILADHLRALGDADKVKTLRAVGDAGDSWLRLPSTCRRDLAGGRQQEWFGEEGAFIRREGFFERFRPDQLTTRGTYFYMKAFAEPFPLLSYVRDPARKALLKVDTPKGFEVLYTPRDRFGIRTVYLLAAKTHLLTEIRFEIVDNQPFAAIRFADHRATGGVMLPHIVSARFLNNVEDMQKGGFDLKQSERSEHIRGWEVDPSVDAIDFVPPGLGGGGGKGFERVVVPTAPDPMDLAVGDLDGDGKPDLAVACEGGVFVRFGADGATKFVELGKGHHHGLAIDDFNGDGRLEVLTTSNVKPDRTFLFVGFDGARVATVRDYYGAPRFVQGLVVDDFDYDGLPDVAATGYASRDLGIRFGNGCMGFRQVGTQWPLALRGGKERGFGIASGDIDRNRMRDLAVADGFRVTIYRGEFNLAFLPEIRIPEKVDPKEPWLPVAVALADLDGDERDDLIVARESPRVDLLHDVIVFMNRPTEDGKMAFTASGQADLGQRVQAVAAGPLDADPATDVAAVSFLTGDLVICSGDGKGGLGPPERYASGRGPCRIALADWDRDGRCDILVSNRLSDSVSIFLNRQEGARPPPPPAARAVLASGPVEEKFELEGLSDPYEFAGEYRLPREIQDPSGIACLGSDPAGDQLVIVSDKRSALFRLTLDRIGKRLLVGPAVPLIGLERERLDLEAVAWDQWTGNLFLGCEADSSIVRADLFGHVLGRAKTGIESGGNDGIEAVAFRRLKDGTPLLYVFRERVGTTGTQPPYDVYGIAEDPLTLVPRHSGLKLPVPLVLDQTDAAMIADRLYVTSRLTREVLEFRMKDDLPSAEDVRRASYLKLTDELLGLRNKEHPLFGNVEGIAVDWNLDLFLLIDNNRETMGVAGRNEGSEGRLLWFRCKGIPPPRVGRPERWHVQRIVVPDGEGARGLAAQLLKQARDGVPLEKLADAVGLEGPLWSRIADTRISALPGEIRLFDLPVAVGRVVENMAVGDVELCEYDAQECPEGWVIVRRAE